MKTKIVYSVISDGTDTYIEQLLISVFSLKKQSRDCNVILVTDALTKRVFELNYDDYLSIFDEVIVGNTPDNYTKVQRSRHLKTSLRQLVKGNFLFVDTDTIITSDLSECDNWTDDLCAVLDKHSLIPSHPSRAHIIRQCKYAGFDINKDGNGTYFNSGLIFVKDSEIANKFYECWHSEWTEHTVQGFHTDQPAMAKVNAKMGFVIKELPGTWNCQISDNGLPFLSQSKLIHYFNSSIMKEETDNIYSFMNKSLFYEIRQHKGLTDHVISLLEDPRACFSNKIMIVSGNYLKFHDTASYKKLEKLYFYHKYIFRFLESILVFKDKIYFMFNK